MDSLFLKKISVKRNVRKVKAKAIIFPRFSIKLHLVDKHPEAER